MAFGRSGKGSAKEIVAVFGRSYLSFILEHNDLLKKLCLINCLAELYIFKAMSALEIQDKMYVSKL